MPNLPYTIAALLASLVLGPVGRAQASDTPQASNIWTDPATRLMWTASDNGSGLSGLQAVRYCRANRTGGFHDWSLPSIDQLQTLVTPAANDSGYHVKGPLHLSGWQWSFTRGEAPGEFWSLDFGDGARASVLTGDSGLNRALCTRPAP